MDVENEQRYFRTIIVIEVLSADPEGPPTPDMPLHSLATAIDSGPYSGALSAFQTMQVDRDTMAQLLLLQGSDPGFLITETEDDDDDL